MARQLTHPSALATHSEHLTTRSNELSIALNSAISDHATVDDAVHKLRTLVPDVIRLRGLVDGRDIQKGVVGRFGYAQDVEEDEEVLKARLGVVGRVGEVFGTSERVGGKVRRLDGRLGRVREAVARVGEVMEFKRESSPSEAEKLSRAKREYTAERLFRAQRASSVSRAQRESSRAQREPSFRAQREYAAATLPSTARIPSEEGTTDR
ncbi:hypothetical protein QFC20_001070 [Naganishia adeliensis]|uniref:Uncharacterized protein n=1 Tax=Naganishia adeliensis TaxID=92952 RepID=A0ACC2WUT5_9TREE|nr:hypothetical protein QFC20_001070 [Naganishia adeliensis]